MGCYGLNSSEPLATDRADHFIEAPARRGRLFPTSKVRCDLRSELDGPAADGFVADFDATLSQHLLDIAKT